MYDDVTDDSGVQPAAGCAQDPGLAAIAHQTGLFWFLVGLFWFLVGLFSRPWTRCHCTSNRSLLSAVALGLFWFLVGLFWFLVGLFWFLVGLFWFLVGLVSRPWTRYRCTSNRCQHTNLLHTHTCSLLHTNLLHLLPLPLHIKQASAY